MVERYLVTTADESTWPKNTRQPILFLGEWCRRYSRKVVWQNLDAEVLPYHWDDRTKLFNDYKYLQKIYENILSELSDKLNKIHSVEHSYRYWRILVGPWLGYFIQVLYDRWFMLKQAVEQTDIIECNVLVREFGSIIPNDMTHFTKLFVNDDWNEAIYAQILELCWGDVFPIKKLHKQPIENKFASNTIQKEKITIKGRIERWICHFSKFFLKDDAYFFISSYLPLKTEFKLQKRLGQIPKRWQSQALQFIPPITDKRKWKLDKNVSFDDSFESLTRQLVPLHIPTAYLEGYEHLVNTTNKLDWPAKPKCIFTSNAYLADDLFKAWTAEQTDDGIPLIIGQHGGHFGMSPFAFYEEHQIDIADKWLSWGWTDQTRPQITPVGNLKVVERDVVYDPNGGALMVEMVMPRYSYHLYAAPISGQWLEYLEEQRIFLKKLPDDLREQIMLRLYHNDYGWDQMARWKNDMPDIHIDPGKQDIRKLVKKCRLYISTYNATTYLESLSWNIPTIIFWKQEHWEIKDEVKPYFDLLKSAGIYHESPESAAQQMIDVWDDVTTWWESENVQAARKKFCHHFSRRSNKLLDELVTVFETANH